MSRDTLLGSVLRLDINTESSPYVIPPHNPFVGSSDTRPEIYAYGLRNPWRCSQDRGDRFTRAGEGRIFCGDVGQNAYEEVDLIEKGGNYGWSAYEGNHCYKESPCTATKLGKRQSKEAPAYVQIKFILDRAVALVSSSAGSINYIPPDRCKDWGK